ncbi:tyrosine-type recombinase/integrase [Paraburkholderia sp. GAS348]|uniref:tyrosine-type recombinase/integrase n=1 Tax=Paraburkholderia sp. GAS348 TaxID=3035132 RepID=UPI003D1FD03D
MPTAKGLTDTQIKNAKPGAKPRKLYDRDRLYVLVGTSGSRRWYWSYRLGDKDATYTIGEYPEVGLLRARELRADAAKLVGQGLQPPPLKIKPAKVKTTPVPGSSVHTPMAVQLTAPASASANDWESGWENVIPGSLAGIAREWLGKKTPGWGVDHAAKVRKLLERYVRDTPLGALPVQDVQTGDLYELVTSVAVRKDRALIGGERKSEAPHNAIVIRRALDAVFRLAIMKGKTKTNPMVDLRTSEVIEKPATRHNTKLNDAGLSELLTAVEKYRGQRLTKLAIELLTLTALRTVEVRGADWKEIDWEKHTWNVPASRMKRRIAHSVPLSSQALSVLEKLRVLTGGKGWLLPNQRRPVDFMATTTINSALANMGFGGDTGNWFRAHGVRGTFYSWALRNKYQSEAADQQLAHKERDPVKAAYLAENAEQFWLERVKMMDAWGDYLDNLKATNVQ